MTTEPRAQVQNLIRDLKIDGRIYKVGATKGARWYPGRPSSGIASKENK